MTAADPARTPPATDPADDARAHVRVARAHLTRELHLTAIAHGVLAVAAHLDRIATHLEHP